MCAYACVCVGARVCVSVCVCVCVCVQPPGAIKNYWRGLDFRIIAAAFQFGFMALAVDVIYRRASPVTAKED